MPSQAMRDAIDAIRDRQQASVGQAPPTLEERRAAFVPSMTERACLLDPACDCAIVTRSPVLSCQYLANATLISW